MIKEMDIFRILPESVAPHLRIPEVRIDKGHFRSQIKYLLRFLVLQYLGNPPTFCSQNLSIDQRVIQCTYSRSSGSTSEKHEMFL
jgi:hypothetical protein